MELVMLLLPLLQVEPDKKADLDKTKLFVYDSSKGMTLRVRDDGKVELKVTETDDDGKKVSKSYSADSAEEFQKKYPGVVRKHGLGRYLGAPGGGVPQDDFDKWWSDLKKGRRFFELPDFQFPFDQDWEKWMEEQQKRFEDYRKEFRKHFGEPDAQPAPAPGRPGGQGALTPGGREFGVKVDSVSETLRDQLSLKEGEGVQVGEVKPGSLAEKAAVLRHDIILKVDGKAVTDKWQFRRDVLEALGKPQFELEVIRGGKRETLKVKTGAKKDE